MSSITLKDHFRETKVFNARAIIAFILSVIAIVVIVSRLLYLQVVEYDLYNTLSENNRFNIGAIVPTRGLIYDNHGVLLAQNIPTYTLEIIPERVKDVRKTVEALSAVIEINETDQKRFFKQVKRSRPFKPIPLRTRLSSEEMARIAVNRHRFPGVDVAAKLIRHYPHGGLGVHALGYVGRINEEEEKEVDASDYDGTDFIGKNGIEKFYETTLHGHVGVKQVETTATGRALRGIEQVPSEPGLALHLTLDASMQAIAESALGEHKGSVVAINPKDGSILTLASTPTYDPNLFVTGIDNKTYQSLRNSEEKPLFNRAMQGRYPPGSTIKPFVGLAGLEYGVVKPDTKIVCPGWFSLPRDRHRYRDWKKEGHGKAIDLNFAIYQSCDVYFYDLASKLGIDRLSQYLMPFGFNYKTGVDISGEFAGLMPTQNWKKRTKNEPWYRGETVITGIGQGYVLVTPLQLASSTATLSQYGKRMQPRIVASTENLRTGEVEFLPPVQDTPVPVENRENWDIILKAMKNVAHHWRGTAYRIGKKSKYKIAGKTGTAQVFSVKQTEEYDETKIAKKLRDHALFIAFAPADDPLIAVAVIVENGGHGGSTAAPIAKKIMDFYLKDKLPTKEKTTKK